MRENFSSLISRNYESNVLRIIAVAPQLEVACSLKLSSRIFFFFLRIQWAVALRTKVESKRFDCRCADYALLVAKFDFSSFAVLEKSF